MLRIPSIWTKPYAEALLVDMAVFFAAYPCVVTWTDQAFGAKSLKCNADDWSQL